MEKSKGLMEGLLAVLSASSSVDTKEEETEGVSSRDLRKHFPKLYKDYVTMSGEQSVEEYLTDINMLDSVLLVMDEDEMKEMGGQEDEYE
jgi:hypothetical protein